jgi:hypothetical protein
VLAAKKLDWLAEVTVQPVAVINKTFEVDAKCNVFVADCSVVRESSNDKPTLDTEPDA